jgi:hypothetical protein
VNSEEAKLKAIAKGVEMLHIYNLLEDAHGEFEELLEACDDVWLVEAIVSARFMFAAGRYLTDLMRELGYQPHPGLAMPGETQEGS